MDFMFAIHWKESAGRILSIFNAKVRCEDKGNEFSLSVFAVDQIVNLGTSVDYEGERKDGMPCTMIINRSQGSYCQYHVAAMRQKYTTKRAELSGGKLSTTFQNTLSDKSGINTSKLAALKVFGAGAQLHHIILETNF